MSKDLGEFTAIAIADIHEQCGKGPPGDTCRDRYNNGVGASIGSFGDVSCFHQCQDALRRGFLQTKPGCGGFGGPNRPGRPNG